jgi:hypothetical protein
MRICSCGKEHGPGYVCVVRYDGKRELIAIDSRFYGAPGLFAASDFHLRRLQESPEVWECRCLMAIFGYVHNCPEGEENSDPFDDGCTANYATGRGMTKAQAVQGLCDDLKKTSDSQWEE